MPEQTVVEVPLETERVCASCKHFAELDGGFFCKLLDAFLSEQTLYLPCDFKENIE